MKKVLTFTGLIATIALLACMTSSAVASGVTIELVNPPPDDLLVLDVGESQTFEIQIESDAPFILAIALTDAYYPGRGVKWSGNDTAHHTTSATLYLTMEGKGPTDYLQAVYDWPEEGIDWPAGVAPVSIAVGVRYKGGVVVGERFNFAVQVP